MADIVKVGPQDSTGKKEIWARPSMKFDMRDIAEYSWKQTRYFYGSGHYLGLLESEGIRHKEHCSIPILLRDDETWSVPFYRHQKRKLEFFIPGITQGVPDRYINPYTFYVLSDEEKERCRVMVREDFGLRALKEMDILKNVYDSYFDKPPNVHGSPGEFVLLFGKDLYKGEDIEKFRKRMLETKHGPTVEIYV